MRVVKIIIATIAIVTFVLLVGFSVRPVQIGSVEDALSAEGVVSDVYQATEYDLVFVLHDHESRYYINRGLQRGLKLEELTSLIGKKGVFKYPKHWTLLDWNN